MNSPDTDGNVPLRWLLQAHSCTRAALVVGTSLWWCSNQAKSYRFRVTVARLAQVSETSTRTVQRGLKELAELGLISVDRPAGWELIVILRDGTTEADQ